jgi:hypothetical protein
MRIMAVSAIDKELLKYFTQLDEPQKKSLLELIKTFLKAGEEPMGRVSLAQYNRELDEAMERISRGEFTTLEALEKEMQSW